MDKVKQVLKEANDFRVKRSSLAKNLKVVDDKYNNIAMKSNDAHKSKLEQIENSKNNKIASLEKSTSKQIADYSQMKISLEEYVKPARKWCSAMELSRYVPNPSRVNEQELNQLISMIQEQGILAWIKRTFKLGGYSSREAMARELCEKVEDAGAYINERIEELQQKASREKSTYVTEARRSIDAENNRYTAESQENAKKKAEQKDQALLALKKFDSSVELRDMFSKVARMKTEAENSSGAWGEYLSPSVMPEQLYFCDAGIILPDENGIDKNVGVPTWINMFESNIIVVTSDSGAKTNVDCPEKMFVRKLLARMLKTIPPEYCSYSIFDSLHKGASLERLIDVTNVGTTDFNFDLFTTDESGSKSVSCAERRKYLKSRPAEIIKFTAGKSKSLFEHNRAAGDFEFPFSWYIDFNFPDEPEDKLLEDIKELFVNATAAGYSFIFVTSPNGYQYIEQLAKAYTNTPIIHVDVDKSVCKKEDLSFRYSAECSPSAEQIYNFMSALKKFYEDGDLINNRINEVFGASGIVMRDASKKLTIPMALDSRGQLVDLELGGEGSVHGFISGGTNSGKSTLLHTIILSACLHYHPQDLEIWLVDYKQTEFYLYKKKTPPHIKLIGVSKTADFTFSLLEKIESEANRRTELMNRFEAQNLEEYRKHKDEPGYENIPRLFIVIDEFHEMSQFVASEMEYKDKLENILREYRAQGITCLMADQTFSTGLSGLTGAAKNQIGLRIAMRNEASPQEIKDTLEVDRALYSDSMQKTIAIMSQGEFIMKVYVRNSRGELTDIKLEKFRGLFSKGEDIAPIAKALRSAYKGQYTKDLLYVNTKEQVPWDDAEPMALDQIEPLRYPNMRLYLGRSATLRPCFGLDMGRQPDENMSIVGGEAYQRWELIAAILRSCYFRNYKVYVFMAEYSDIYSDYGQILTQYCNGMPTAELMVTYEEWCEKLAELESLIDNRANEEDAICLFIGLEIASVELGRMPDRNQGGAPAADSFSARMARLSSFGAPVEDTVAQAAAPVNESKEFNALPIIDKLFSSGARNGIRCVMEASVYRQYSKILKVKEMSRHKIAFSMSADDCLMYLGNSNYQKTIGQNAVYCDGGKEVKKLLTYKLQ